MSENDFRIFETLTKFFIFLKRNATTGMYPSTKYSSQNRSAPVLILHKV